MVFASRVFSLVAMLSGVSDCDRWNWLDLFVMWAILPMFRFGACKTVPQGTAGNGRAIASWPLPCFEGPGNPGPCAFLEPVIIRAQCVSN